MPDLVRTQTMTALLAEFNRRLRRLETANPAAQGLTVQASSTIYSGTGIPSNALGANGDYYFRTDTPTVANQRLYSRAAGVWTGIL